MDRQLGIKTLKLIDHAKSAARMLRGYGESDADASLLAIEIQDCADNLESRVIAEIEAAREYERPIVGDNVKITGGEYIGFIGTYIADRDNGSARYPVVKLRDGTETFVVDPMHLRKL